METKYNVCDKVSYFNDASQKIENSTVQGIKIIATKIHANEKGEDICDEQVAVYALKNGANAPENALFPSDDECKDYYKKLFAEM